MLVGREECTWEHTRANALLLIDMLAVQSRNADGMMTTTEMVKVPRTGPAPMSSWEESFMLPPPRYQGQRGWMQSPRTV